ncbi:MAG TPA: hypothetical protein VKR05_01950, partial [Candidatus Cybelea sp.]|nr:hypothetical protein [Candidatus Cybelea sp.]
MDQAGNVRRLRVAGIVAVATIAFMVLVQNNALEWRLATAPVQTDLVNHSGMRRSMTMSVLYYAARMGSFQDTHGLDAAVATLVDRQDELADLQGADLATYQQFIATARQALIHPGDARLQDRLKLLGLQLFDIFDRRTMEYAKRGGEQRATFRNIIWVASGIILVVLAALYFFVMRRRDEVIVNTL